MILSVIIVNFRVRYFLELCLHSVQKALVGLEAEVIVVDNHSDDGSLEFLVPLFPAVRFLANPGNVGFARANNQALKEARGKYILFLNPDTILPEDFARHCFSFVEARPGIGGLGVRMVDGAGRFLKESRRGFPSPWVAFCKLAGLAALFPRSRIFSTYYLGHLPADTAHPAPVLSGACLWVARSILEAIGGFDERFFLYAEDIDLSYRIEKAGYINYYLADTTIVHFKGESTPKDTRYVRQFYKAMSQFRRKHFQKGLPVPIDMAVETAIWCRAGISAAGRYLRTGFRGSRTGNSRPVRTWLTGDAAETGKLSALLTDSGQREIVAEKRLADEIIYCEGREFSFRQSIAQLVTDAPYRHGRKFHAAGSRTATGSSDPDGQGETLVF
ncbi:MAG TPA: glycosyltransferase family 2 protein [Puia sp.]|jgi:N-acetylglucosaminyl-diphospho-decaprenol L-rhamnosyltransferase|nr:glycosyltransferase family 2 protein [Puia sp.]